MATPPPSESDESSPESTAPAPVSPVPLTDTWERLKENKVLQWGLAYLGAALAFAHGGDLLGHAFNWPEMLNRLILGFLIVGFPIALALAWYHGHKGLKQITTGEMTVVSFLILIGAGLLVVMVRAPAESSAEAPARDMSPALSRGSHSSAADAANSSAQSVAAVSAASVAVVPFVNLTGEAAKEYFSDGMAEELINSLSQVPGLKVPARTSSFAYKGRSVDIRQIAQDLGVATILEGSVRSAGDRIRVTAELVDARTGFHTWSKSYDRQFGDIFKLQDELAAAIVQALREHLNVTLPEAAPRAAPTQDVVAYQLYLQAGSIQNGSLESFRQSIALYDQAIARDPSFSRAFAGRAWVRASFVTFGFPVPHALEDAENDARRALALDPNQATAHSVLGITNALHGKWVEAELSFRAAIAADPTDAEILSTYAVTVLANTGRLREWRAKALEAYRLAPANALPVITLGLADVAMGQDADAKNSADLALKLNITPQLASSIYTKIASREGHYAEAAKYGVQIMPLSGVKAGGVETVQLAYAALGAPQKHTEARNALRRLAKAMTPAGAGPFGNDVAILYTQLGAIDDAYAWLDQILDAKPAGVVGDIWDLWQPEMASFRRDARFPVFTARLGFMEYWKQYGPPDSCTLEKDKLTCS